MTVASDTARVKYEGNGVTVEFSTGFTFQSNDQVKVIFFDEATGTTLVGTENAEYFLTGAGTGSPGTVSTDGLFVLSAGVFIIIMLDLDFVQPFDGAALGSVDPDDLEDIFDNFQLKLNQLNEAISRANLSAETGDGGPPTSEDLNVNGWSPEFGITEDGARRVLTVVDWTGGTDEDTKPDTGIYVGASGFTATLASGVDVRGPQGTSGAGTGDMLAAQNLNDVANKPTAFANIKQAATTSATGVAELATDGEAQAKADTARVLTPSNLAALAASITFAGLVELATTAEAVTGTDTARAVTPEGVAAAISASGSVPAGSAMLFVQTSAPSGWTKVTAHNDKALRVVSGSAGSGGSVNFSTFFARTGTDAVTLIEANLPVHSHTYDKATAGSATAAGVDNAVAANPLNYSSENTGNVGSGTAFTPAIDCRVKYVDVIIATKD